MLSDGLSGAGILDRAFYDSIELLNALICCVLTVFICKPFHVV